MSTEAIEALQCIYDALATIDGGDVVLDLLCEGREAEAEALMMRMQEAKPCRA